MHSEHPPLSIQRRAHVHGPSEAQIVRALPVVRKKLDSLRKDSSDPLRVLRMRQTRWGWAVIYRAGDGPEQAFEVDARGGKPVAISPERAIAQWTAA